MSKQARRNRVARATGKATSRPLRTSTRKPSATRPRDAVRPHVPDRFDLYELAVTAPVPLARFLVAAHAHDPTTLREDFSGTGALCRGWTNIVPGGRAVAIDFDAEPLARLKGEPHIRAIRADVLKSKHKADVIAATNFPVGYWHTRPQLVRYLRHARACLNRRGVFVCDTYGGADAFKTPLKLTAKLKTKSGLRVKYTWEQRTANARTRRVLDALHFEIAPAKPGGRATLLRDAFVYDWRLWSIPELTAAMLEAGFKSVEVHDRLGDAIDQDGRVYLQPLGPKDRLAKNYVVYLVARR